MCPVRKASCFQMRMGHASLRSWSVSFHVRASKGLGGDDKWVIRARPRSGRRLDLRSHSPKRPHAATPLPSVFGLARVERLGHRRAQVETAPRTPCRVGLGAESLPRHPDEALDELLPERDRILDTEGAQLGISSAREP